MCVQDTGLITNITCKTKGKNITEHHGSILFKTLLKCQYN